MLRRLAVLSALGVGFLLRASQSAWSQDADIVLALPFDEGQGDVTLDLSDQAHEGVLQGATWGDGKIDGGLNFDPDGPQWVDLGNHQDLILADTDFTIAVWAYMTVGDGQQHAFAAQDEGGGQFDKFIFRYRGDHSVLNFVTFNSETGLASQMNSEAWSPDLKTWYQIAVSREGDLFTFFIDATPHGTAESDIAFPSVIEMNFTVGWAEGPISMGGTLDDMLVVRRALTQDEIGVHFDGGVRGSLAVAPVGKLATSWGALRQRPVR